jgi:hypothetical protein
MVVSFAYFTLVQKRPLSASIVFSALMGFTMLRLALLALVNALPNIINATVSIARIQEFLNDVRGSIISYLIQVADHEDRLNSWIAIRLVQM